MKRAMIFETAMTELASLLKDCKFDAAINRAQFLFARACAALSCKSYKAKVIADIIKQFDIEDDNLSVGHLLWILKRDVMSMDHISEAVKDALKNTKFSSAAIALTPRPIITASAEKADMICLIMLAYVVPTHLCRSCQSLGGMWDALCIRNVKKTKMTQF